MVLSTTEVEYIAAVGCATQAIWLRKILGELQYQQNKPTVIFCDNKPTIALTKNPVFHGRSKHIDIKHHYIRELVKNKEIMVEYCASEDQIANIFMKPLKAEQFFKLKRMLGMGKPSLREDVRN